MSKLKCVIIVKLETKDSVTTKAESKAGAIALRSRRYGSH